MTLPKVTFRFSVPYDEAWKDTLPASRKSEMRADKTQGYLCRVEMTWRVVEPQLVSAMARVTGLRWLESSIVCYVVSAAPRPFSDPLTIPARFHDDRFVDILTHELIHQLISQNCRRFPHVRTAVHRHVQRYKHEGEIVAIHVLVHAVLGRVLRRVFDDERVEDEIGISSRETAYKRAWDIVRREGEDTVISRFQHDANALRKRYSGLPSIQADAA